MRPLRRPGGVAADIEGRVAVSDTGNDRVVFGRMIGERLEVTRVVGGAPGFADGPLDAAAFREPRGLVLLGDLLIVADRGNHAVRMIDLAAGTVATMAGTGVEAAGPAAPGPALETPLGSPWDALLHLADLFVGAAAAGEVVRLDLRGGGLSAHLALPPADGGEPAPVALASDGTALFAARGGAVVRAGLEPGAPVEAVATEGIGRAAGLAWGQGNHRLWVSDAADHALLTVDPESGRVETVEPFDATLADPAGLASAGHVLFVADSGHDRILRVDQIDKRVVALDVVGA